MSFWIQKQVGLIWLCYFLSGGTHGFSTSTVPERRFSIRLPSASSNNGGADAGGGGMDATARAFLAYQQSPPVMAPDDDRSVAKSTDVIFAAPTQETADEPIIAFDRIVNDGNGLESNERNGEQIPFQFEDEALARSTTLLDEESIEVSTEKSNDGVPAEDDSKPWSSNEIQSATEIVEVDTINISSSASPEQESTLNEKARLLFGGGETTANGKEMSSKSSAAIDRNDQDDIIDEGTVPAPPASTKATITKVTSLSSPSKVNSVVATTRARQRLKEEEEAKPNVLLQIIGDLVFSKSDDDKKKPTRKEDESPILKELTESLKSKIKAETTTKPDPIAVPPETYHFNINAKQGVWNPSEEGDDIEEAAQRSWTASLDSRGNFWVTYFDEEITDAIPRRTSEGANDWDQYQNASGRIYFVNRATGESQWHVPPGFEVVDMQKPEEEEEVQPVATSPIPTKVKAKEDEEVSSVGVTKDEAKSLPPILTPIQRLLGEMSAEEKEELSRGVVKKNKAETTSSDSKTSGFPSPIQRLLGQMQKEEDSSTAAKIETSGEKAVAAKPDTSGLPYPIQRLFSQKNQPQESEDGKTKTQGDARKRKQKSGGVKPFWAASNTTPPVDKKPEGIRPFWNLKK